MSKEDDTFIPDTDYERIPKLIARYIEFPQFKDANLRKGYYCASCVYFYEGHDDCAIVRRKGESADGQTSDHIAPFAMCSLWKPNMELIKGSS